MFQRQRTWAELHAVDVASEMVRARIIMLLISIRSVLNITAFSEWSTEDYSVFDDELNYYWNFPYDAYHTWERIAPNGRHTLFMAYQKPTDITAYVAYKPVAPGMTIDDIYENMEDLMEPLRHKSPSPGVHCYLLDYKYKLYGMNDNLGIRVYTKEKIVENGLAIVYYSLNYYLLSGMNLFIITAKCPTASFKKYGIAYLEGVLHGFHPCS